MADLATSICRMAGIATLALGSMLTPASASPVCDASAFKQHPKWFRLGGFCEALMATAREQSGGYGRVASRSGGSGGGFTPHTQYVTWDISDPNSEHFYSSTPPASGPYAVQTLTSPHTMKTVGITGAEHTWHRAEPSGGYTLVR